MSRLIAILLTLCTLGAAAAPPRVALVRITDIYQKLPSTASEQAIIKKLHEDILNDRRAEDMRRVVDELKALNAEMQAVAKEPGNDLGKKAKISQAYEDKRLTLESLQKDFETYRDEQTLEINRKMVGYMRASLSRISAEAKALAQKKGFDLLIDSSGNTNTGLPVLLYVKNAPDLTDELLAILNPAAPPENTAAQTPPAPGPGNPASSPTPTPVH